MSNSQKMSMPQDKSVKMTAKPHGPIPPYFGQDGAELLIGGATAESIVAANGATPMFVYSTGALDARISELRAAMPEELGLHYAMKANPFGPLVSHMNAQLDGLDIASGGELKIAMAAGVEPASISFAGPGKQDWEIEDAVLNHVTLNAESEGEVARAIAMGERLGIRPQIAVRVNPSFDLKGSGMKMGGGAKQFGVDAERVPALVKHILASKADWRGFHIYAGSQALKAESVVETQAQTIELAAQLSEVIGAAPPKVNLGGGFGIPYFPGDEPLDITAVGQALGAALAARADILKDTHFCIELGRYLVGEAGVYLTRIVDRKVSHGETFLITDGGLHHQLAASGNFGTVVRRNYPIAVASGMNRTPEEQTVVGCLCTPLDLLGNKVMIPHADRGDLIAVFCAGAYGASASPASFLGQGPAREVMAS